MPAETVPLVLDIYDGAQDLAGTGHVILVPSSAVNDTVNHQAIMVPLNVDLIGTETNGGLPLTVHLRPTDDPGITPSGWAWTATFWNVPGVTNGSVQVFALPYNGGATNYLSSVITVQNPVTYQAYLPLPSGTPTSGQVPVATGSGEASAWTTPAGGTVTSVSGEPANGFTVSVADETTTPQVEVGTSVTGLLKGNGTGVSAAAAGTDYLAPAGDGSQLTGITAGQVGADASGAAAAVLASSAQKSANLSDLASASTARTNLGLGSAATHASTDFDAAGAAAAAAAASVPLSDLPLSLANGGTGQTAQQAALDALAGAVTSGLLLRGNGTHVSLAALQAGDVPTLNQNTTGTAGGLSSALAVGSGGTGQVTAAAAYNALSPMTAKGDMEYDSAAGTAARLPVGSAGQVLGVAAGVPAWQAGLTLQAATTLAGYTLVNGTGTIISWTTPNDGALHRVMVFASLHVSSTETGGTISLQYTLPDGTLSATHTLLSGNAVTGDGFPAGAFMVVVEGNTPVTVKQLNALTGGAAVMWAEIWGS